MVSRVQAGIVSGSSLDRLWIMERCVWSQGAWEAARREPVGTLLIIYALTRVAPTARVAPRAPLLCEDPPRPGLCSPFSPFGLLLP